jgi:hypothetical protein
MSEHTKLSHLDAMHKCPPHARRSGSKRLFVRLSPDAYSVLLESRQCDEPLGDTLSRILCNCARVLADED